MKRVLVTGATGFIGRHCLPLLLKNDYEVHAVSSRAREEKTPDVQWHFADLLQKEQTLEIMARAKPTHLLHFAWYAVPGKYWTSLENVRWVQASLDLLQAFAREGGRRAVMAGSCAEYDWSYGYCSEEKTPLSPGTLYGTCKHALQRISDGVAKETRLSSAWGRIFFVYGPQEAPTRLIPSVICSLLNGRPAHCAHGDLVRDYLHVEDVAAAFVAILNSHLSGPVNIGSGEPVSLKEIVLRMGQKVGRPELIRIGEAKRPTDEPPLLVSDVRKLKTQANWLPAYNLDAGLDRTIQWWRDRLQATS